VRLLFDENLSPRLPGLLAEIYPGSEHVQNCGLSRASDTGVWEYAKTHGFTIVSKDSDFQERSILWGSPPKVIWLRTRNCKSADVAELLRNARAIVEQFGEHDSETFLELGNREVKD